MYYKSIILETSYHLFNATTHERVRLRQLENQQKQKLIECYVCTARCTFQFYCNQCIVKNFFQVSRPRTRHGSSGLETETWTKWTRVHYSSLETMVSKSHHWLHQFQLVTEHSLKGATNYGNRATGVGTKHAVLRPRPRPGQNELECTRVSRPWSRDHNTVTHTYTHTYTFMTILFDS